MKLEASEKETVIVRTLVVLATILLAAALRITPHPWNLTPIGAMALFSGAMIRDRRFAFLFPLLALFAGDIVIGFHKLMPWVYASFLVNVALGNILRDRQTTARIGGMTLLGAIQFFVITNFGVWATYHTYPRTAPGLLACYVAGIPYFWNTLAGDFLYAALLFGGFAIAARLVPALRPPIVEAR